MSELKTNKISPAVGTGVTLGDSGDTFTIPAGATITNSGTSTGFSDPARNFIIDGDFTQWPEGTTKTAVHSQYTSALMMSKTLMQQLVWDAKQTSDSPTVAESGHASTYCYHADITTAESALAVNDYSSARYHVTANDFSHLHQKEMTLSFWHKHTKTGTSCVSIGNSASDRYYVATYTQSVADTWEKATITLTGDTVGTWLYAGTGVGMHISFILASGSDYHTTANTWTAGFKVGVNGMADHTDSASNNFKIAQVGLYKGSSAPSSFIAEPIATVIDQVQYYVEQLVSSAVVGQYLGSGYAWNVDNQTYPLYYRAKRTIPSGTISAAASWQITNRAISTDCASVAISGFGISNATFTTVGSSTINAFDPVLLRAKTTAASILLDARH
jgi:hypothetical protein